MNEFICNYAIARFLPYRETGEFANVGVVLMCPQTGYFDFLFEKRKHKRVTDFFPELNVEVLKAGLQAFALELERLKGTEKYHGTPFLFDEAVTAGQQRFRELVRPRETLLHFGEISTVTTSDPSKKLKSVSEKSGAYD